MHVQIIKMGCCQTMDSDLQAGEMVSIIASESLKRPQGTKGKLFQENIRDSLFAIDSKAEKFIKENVKIVERSTTLAHKFLKDNINETLDTIKDLKLKERVNDIICPIFRKDFVHSTHGSVEDAYIIHEILGQGSFSTVRRGVHIETNIERAVKVITKKSITEAQKLVYQHETEILKGLDHPNIIRIIEVIEDTFKINIIFELCKGGELFDRIIE